MYEKTQATISVEPYPLTQLSIKFLRSLDDKYYKLFQFNRLKQKTYFCKIAQRSSLSNSGRVAILHASHLKQFFWHRC